MVPQNNYTLKHKSLTKSSSGFSARGITSLTEIFDWPTRKSQWKVNGKFRRFENSPCGGWAVSKTPSDKICFSSHFPGTISEKKEPWDSNPEIANAGASQTISTSSLSMCVSLPASSSVSAWSPTTSCSWTPLGLSWPIPTTIFSSGAHGGWWKRQNEFRQNLQLTQYLLEIKWSPHAGSHYSQTIHRIAKLDYQLLDLHVFFSLATYSFKFWCIYRPAMTSEWYFKDTLRNETKNFLISKLCFPWLVYTLTPSNSTHFYLTSSILPFNTEIQKNLSREENYGEFTYVLRLLTKYSWWIRQLSSANIILHWWFELLLVIGHLVNSRQLWFLCGKFIDEQSSSKTEKKIDHGNALSRKEGSLEVYPRSLRA